MNETASYEIIGDDAEKACFRIYHGDAPAMVKELAKEKVIKSNLRFVLKFAIDYHKITGLPIADFFSEGKLGLLEAFYKFDYTAGVKFGSYAIWYVRTCMSRIVNNERDLIRVPVKLRKSVLKTMRSGKTPSSKYGKYAVQAISGLTSLDSPTATNSGDCDGDPLSNFITYENDSSPQDDYVDASVKEFIHDSISSVLTDSEKNVIVKTFGIDTEESSLADVASDIGTSKEWARRIKARAIEKLRGMKGASKLKNMVK